MIWLNVNRHHKNTRVVQTCCSPPLVTNGPGPFFASLSGSASSQQNMVESGKISLKKREIQGRSKTRGRVPKWKKRVKMLRVREGNICRKGQQESWGENTAEQAVEAWADSVAWVLLSNYLIVKNRPQRCERPFIPSDRVINPCWALGSGVCLRVKEGGE